MTKLGSSFLNGKKGPVPGGIKSFHDCIEIAFSQAHPRTAGGKMVGRVVCADGFVRRNIPNPGAPYVCRSSRAIVYGPVIRNWCPRCLAGLGAHISWACQRRSPAVMF